MPEDSHAAAAHPPAMAAGDFFTSYAKALRASSIRLGKLRVRGVPAILLGASAIVLSAGVSRALRSAAPSLPDALREGTKLVEALRADRPEAKRLNA